MSAHGGCDSVGLYSVFCILLNVLPMAVLERFDCQECVLPVVSVRFHSLLGKGVSYRPGPDPRGTCMADNI